MPCYSRITYWAPFKNSSSKAIRSTIPHIYTVTVCYMICEQLYLSCVHYTIIFQHYFHNIKNVLVIFTLILWIPEISNTRDYTIPVKTIQISKLSGKFLKTRNNENSLLFFLFKVCSSLSPPRKTSFYYCMLIKNKTCNFHKPFKMVTTAKVATFP